MEACRRFGGALSLFERICAPADDVLKARRRLYCKGAFGECGGLRVRARRRGPADGGGAR